MALIGSNNEERIWNYFKSKGFNDFGCAGLMGNLYAESGLNPKNLQNTGNKKLNMTDDEYVYFIDNGIYTKEQFIYDKQGAFLAQWTFYTRKKSLYDYAKSKNKSIGDLEMQLDFLYKELSENYKSVFNSLKTATSVLEASNSVLLKFEKPVDQSASVQKKRSEYGQVYYDKYTKKETVKNDKKEEKNMATKLIALDAGHGLNTPGKRTPDGIHEWELNDKVRDFVVEMLKGYDCEFIFPDGNEGKTDESLTNRKKMYVNKKVDAAVSIHHNATSDKWVSKGIGVETYTDKNATKADTLLAKAIQKRLAKYTGLKDRGVKKANWTVINQNTVPAVLVEGAFMNSRVDYKVITSTEGQKAYARAVAEGLIEFLDLKKKTNKVDVPKKEAPKKETVKKEESKKETPKKTSGNSKVKEWQNAAIKDGLKLPSGADGIWGSECEAIAKKAICKKRVTYKYKNLTKIVQNAVGVTADGKFGEKTRLAVIRWQKKNGLVDDGCVGLKSWKKLLGVK